MNYENIKKHLGEEWLNEQITSIETKKWISKNESNIKLPTPPAYQFLEKINLLIGRFENVEGFSKWVEEAKTTKTFEDHLFELMVMDNLLRKTDSLKLKIPNPNNGSEPEALAKKGEDSFYIEMKKFRDLPSSSTNAAKRLFNKARDKFEGSQGILFVGAFNFFEYSNGNETILPEFNLLKNAIKYRFERATCSSILAIILVNFYITTTPDFKNSSIQKRYYIINKPLNKCGKPLEFFKEIFDLDSF